MWPQGEKESFGMQLDTSPSGLVRFCDLEIILIWFTSSTRFTEKKNGKMSNVKD